MVSVGLVVPVLSNFQGFTTLMSSVDIPVKPFVAQNWIEGNSVAHSWNLGIDALRDCDVVVVSNDDVTFFPGTLQKLVDYAQDYDLVSVVGSDTGQSGYHNEGFPDFCCFAIKPVEFTNRFGTFDENFYPAYFEDNDMHRRIKLMGGEAGMILDARVDHIGSFTQFKHGTDRENRVVSHEQFLRNRRYYEAKWGGEPGQERFDTPFNYGFGANLWALVT